MVGRCSHAGMGCSVLRQGPEWGVDRILAPWTEWSKWVLLFYPPLLWKPRERRKLPLYRPVLYLQYLKQFFGLISEYSPRLDLGADAG